MNKYILALVLCTLSQLSFSSSPNQPVNRLKINEFTLAPFVYGKVPGPLVPGSKNWNKHRQIEQEDDQERARQQQIAYQIWYQQWHRQQAEQERIYQAQLTAREMTRASAIYRYDNSRMKAPEYGCSVQ